MTYANNLSSTPSSPRGGLLSQATDRRPFKAFSTVHRTVEIACGNRLRTSNRHKLSGERNPVSREKNKMTKELF